MIVHVEAMKELAEPLAELGRRWAASTHRPKPSPEALAKWDVILDAWVASDLPLVLRDSRRRTMVVTTDYGRKIVFADNTPANWMFDLALRNEAPDLATLTHENFISMVPLSFLAKGSFARRDLNKQGWKVCHIANVSDGKRYAVEAAPASVLEAEFRRFLSPRNVFLIPKAISGAGELPEVINAIAAVNRG
ncbi:MAG: hypothetical protein V4559_08915 [Pseudomonadota bacterium]